ncbi:hypothetical protein HMPREF1145_2035 [Oribacterium parvum ACB8]|nr:hypothetical protein HMPREF1145_2035 [Oribacterium parvum ACB8]
MLFLCLKRIYGCKIDLPDVFFFVVFVFINNAVYADNID